MNLWAVAVYTVASVYRHVIGYKKYCQICKIHPVTAKHVGNVRNLFEKLWDEP